MGEGPGKDAFDAFRKAAFMGTTVYHCAWYSHLLWRSLHNVPMYAT